MPINELIMQIVRRIVWSRLGSDLHTSTFLVTIGEQTIVIKMFAIAVTPISRWYATKGTNDFHFLRCDNKIFVNIRRNLSDMRMIASTSPNTMPRVFLIVTFTFF